MVGDPKGPVSLKALEGGAESGYPDTLDSVLRALNHPVRRRILRELSTGPASASGLAQRLGEELGMVSYHLSQVLHKECRMVELVDTIARRGALEKIYGLDSRPLEQLVCDPDLEAGGYGAFPLEVDDSTWQEICEAQREFEDRIADAVQEGHARGAGIGLSKTRRVVVAVAALPLGAASNKFQPELQADART